MESESIRPTLLGQLLYYLLPIRRRTVMNNLRLVFGHRMSEKQVRMLAQQFYAHIFRVICENFAMTWMSQESLKNQARVVGDEHILRAAEKKKGVLLLTGHFGNWELTPVAVLQYFQQFRGRFHVLRRTLVNKAIEHILFNRFYEAGLNVIPKKNSLGQVLDCLSKNDVVAFIMDQHAKIGKDGVLVDFFGCKAGTFKSLAVIARNTGAPVIPAVCYREDNGKHVMEFFEELSWIHHPDSDLEILENTQNYNRILEKMVLAHPEQWWWVHRRWKSK